MNKQSSYDFTLDLSKGIVRFPKICAICGKVVNDNLTVNIQSNPTGYYGYLVWLFSGRKKYKFPIHKECILKAKTTTIRTFFTIFFLTLALTAGIYYKIEGIEFLILVLSPLLALIIIGIANPVPLEFDKSGNTVFFTFKNLKFAKEFADINEKIVISANLDSFSYQIDEGEKPYSKFNSTIINAIILLSIFGMLVSIYSRMK